MKRPLPSLLLLPLALFAGCVINQAEDDNNTIGSGASAGATTTTTTVTGGGTQGSASQTATGNPTTLGSGSVGSSSTGAAICVANRQTCAADGLPCCDETDACVGDDVSGFTCEAACTTHSECGQTCCGAVTGLGKFASELYCQASADACDAPCINTCGPKAYDGAYAFDGECDEPDLCEPGTDCFDCAGKAMVAGAQIGVFQVVAHEHNPSKHQVRIVFDQPIALARAGELIAIITPEGQHAQLTVTRPEDNTLNGIPVPARHVVVARWTMETSQHLRLSVANAAPSTDYRASF